MSDTTQMSGVLLETPKEATEGFNCLNCLKREFCTEICVEVENLLPKKTTGRHKKEATVSLNYLEILATERVFKLRFGRGYNIFKHEID